MHVSFSPSFYQTGFLRGTHLDHTLLDIEGTVVLVSNPSHAAAAEGTDTHAEDTTKDGVRGGHGHADPRSNSQVGRRGNDGAHHAQHQQSRRAVESLSVDDLGADGVGHTATNTESTSKLH